MINNYPKQNPNHHGWLILVTIPSPNTKSLKSHQTKPDIKWVPKIGCIVFNIRWMGLQRDTPHFGVVQNLGLIAILTGKWWFTDGFRVPIWQNSYWWWCFPVPPPGNGWWNPMCKDKPPCLMVKSLYTMVKITCKHLFPTTILKLLDSYVPCLKSWETGEIPTISCSNHPILLVKFQFSPLKSQAPDGSIDASVAPWPCAAGAMLASSCGAEEAVLRASEGATGASSAYGSDGSWEFCRLIPQWSFPMEH
jgi:hypothetical protein